MYKEYKGLNLPEIDKQILNFWDTEGVFDKSVEQRDPNNTFVFYEGPPSANGLPGIHHVMARTIKDIFCRFQTLNGKRVERKGGWDTHGLPIELAVEKELGITKEDIGKKISVDDYNHKCRETVMRYKDLWDDITVKMGYWVDLDNPYVTYENEYIETVWYLLKRLYDKGYLYKGYTIQPYSPAAGTGLSSHELNMPGTYKDVTDTTVVAMFKVTKNDNSEFLFDTEGEDVRILAWTTTPWTLPSNTALTVGPNIDYVKIKTNNPYTHADVSVVLAKDLIDSVLKQIGKNPYILIEKWISEVLIGGTHPSSTGKENDDFDGYINNLPIEVKYLSDATTIEKFSKKIKEKGFSKGYYIAFRRFGEGALPENVEVYLVDDLIEGKVSIFPNQKAIAEKPIKFKGEILRGVEYEQLFNYGNEIEPLNGKTDAFKVITGDFVTTTDGTGIVHTAPSFGADDMKVGRQNGIGALTLVDKQGKFTDNVGEFSGRYVKDYMNEPNYVDVNVDISVKLKLEGYAFNVQKYVHSYPHCWRTDKPVLYYPLDSWFIAASKAKDRMFELNKTINWKPAATGEGRFGKWLENLQDWNLSRSRYWGIGLPIWRTSDEDFTEEKCIGSIMELQAEIGKANAAFGLNQTVPKDMHRPYIDEIVLVSDSGEKMYRELDLIDVWFDSGSMPYAQWGLDPEKLKNGDDMPFKAPFNVSYPADFIAEGVDQTRGWFYTLHAIAVMAYDSVAFKNVVSNGLVQDKNGQKMSKSKGNAVEPFETIAKFGADATRWYLISNAQPWDNLKFDIDGITEVRNKFFGTLYNTYNFFAMYANVDGFVQDEMNQTPIESRTELDRWILSKLHSLIAEVSENYATYEPTQAARAIEKFVDNDFSNWFVRLSRRRFWKAAPPAPEGGDKSGTPPLGVGGDKKAAYETMYQCLMIVSQLSSPIAPFFTDWLYKNLTDGIRSKAVENDTPLKHPSVHLTDLAKADNALINKDLEQQMDYAQRISSLILSLRKKAKIRVRQPLQRAMLPILDANFIHQVEAVKDLILAETNVKTLEYITDTSGVVNKRIRPNLKTLGKVLGKNMRAGQLAIEILTQEDISKIEKEKTHPLSIGDQTYNLTIDDFLITSEDIPGWEVANDGDVTVALDITLTPELESEGTARDLVNKIQNIRKDRNFNITDKISVTLERHDAIVAAVEGYADYIKNEVLATSLDLASMDFAETMELNDVVVLGVAVELAPKEFRLWKFIEFTDVWATCDTSIIDDISPAWFNRREKLKNNSTEYIDFLGRLKREHAIETGVIERLYDLKKGITETFIKKGFVESYLSHDDTNVPTQVLMKHLKDHLDAVDFVFDVVKDNRFLSTSFIKELHQLVTRHQTHAEGRDSTGSKVKIPLLKGEYKKRENNPTREDGVVIRYCPPEHVAAEMDRLVEIHNDLLIRNVHPIIISAWVHHAFTTIHPFQDGNGRVGRLLASLILIKANLFPFTVLREEAREKYIDSLEAADRGEPQSLVSYFAALQRRNIEKALNLREINVSSLSEVTNILSDKIQKLSQQKVKERELLIENNRKLIFDYCHSYLQEFRSQFISKINGNTKTSIKSCSFEDTSKQHYYYKQIVEYAKLHDYYFNFTYPKAWIRFRLELNAERMYQLGITIHHFGYDDSTIYIGAFLEFNGDKQSKELTTFPLDVKPHILSIEQNVDKRKKNIELYLENVLTVFLAQVASEL